MSIVTWLPLPDYKDSIATLHNDHLMIQRFHVILILENFLAVPSEDSAIVTATDWPELDEHPILDMWAGHEMQLAEYGLACCDEWQLRKGKRDPFYEPLMHYLNCSATEDADPKKPGWFGEIEFHLSHQAELLRLIPDHYNAYFMPGNIRHLLWPRSAHA